MSDILAGLAAPFPPERVSWRVGSTNGDKTKGLALAYIDARDVYDRLDSVVGPANWQCRYPHAGQKTVCEIGIRIDGEWVWKANGAGDSDVEAEKGAMSDAVKRAAVVWGIGRYLYDVDSPWVEIVQKGRSYVIAEHEYARLRRLLGGAPAPAARPQTKPAADTNKEVLLHKLSPGDSATLRDALILALSRCRTVADVEKWRADNLDKVSTLLRDDKLRVAKAKDDRIAMLSEQPNILAAG